MMMSTLSFVDAVDGDTPMSSLNAFADTIVKTRFQGDWGLKDA
jgi:hypothetical protein